MSLWTKILGWYLLLSGGITLLLGGSGAGASSGGLLQTLFMLPLLVFSGAYIVMGILGVLIGFFLIRS